MTMTCSPRTVRAAAAAKLLGIGFAALASLVIAGCAAAGGPVHSRDASAQLVIDASDTVRIELENGPVRLTRSSRAGLRVGAELGSDREDRAEAAAISIERGSDGIVTVGADFPGGWSSRLNDTAELDVELPDVAAIEVVTADGAVALRGFGCVVSVRTTNGGVTIRDHAGPLRVRTTNGAIGARGVGGPVVLETSNGAIALILDGSPGPIDVQTTNGAVTLAVDDRFRGTLSLSTSNGGVGVKNLSRVGGEILSVTPRSATVRFGGEDQPASTVRTSNGAVELRAAD